MKTETVLQKAISHYGESSQILMLIEETEELYEALTTGLEKRDKVLEEIADVTICLKQAFMIFGLTDDHYPAKGTVKEYVQIRHKVTLFVCRASRGRDCSPDSLFDLAGWIRARVESMGDEKTVREITKQKIIRLQRRMG